MADSEAGARSRALEGLVGGPDEFAEELTRYLDAARS